VKSRFRLWLLAGFVTLLATVAFGLVAPDSVSTVLLGVVFTFWIAVTVAILFWYFWRWLTYRVSVRLLLSYFLLAVMPFFVCLALAGFALYMAMGQYTSVRFGSEMEQLEADLLRDCREIMVLFRASGEEAAAEAFRKAADQPRHLAPRVLWTARLGRLSLASPGAEDLPDLRWITGETSTLAVDGDRAYLLVGTPGDAAPNLVAALVPLDSQTARAVIHALWFDIFFSTLEDDSPDLEDGGGVTVGTKLGGGASMTFNDQDFQVDELWESWSEGELGILYKPWVFWFRLNVDTRQLTDGEPARAVISLLRTSPVNVWRDFTRSKYELGNHLWGALAGMGSVFLVLYGLALLIAATMIVSITRSTSRLTKGARAVERGELDYRIPVKRHDQLGDLAASFNRMTQSVQDMLADVAEKERMAKELELAREIQESLLPDRHLHHGALSVHAIFRPAAAVGGDYFDIFPMGGGRLVVVVGDVAGHGLHAGLLMASLKSTVAAMVREGYTGVELVSKVNALLLERRAGPTMTTLSVIELDTDGGLMTLTNAGHPPAYLIHDGRVKELMVSSLPLGSPLSEPRQIEQAFPQGARLLLYSDGLVEATDGDGEPFTYERLARVVEESATLDGGELEAAILAALDRHVGGRPLDDDLTLLVVEWG